MFTVTNHVLDQAEFLESPNFSERPKGLEPSLLVIHNISLPPGKFGGGYIEDFFQNNIDPFKDKYNLQNYSSVLIGKKSDFTEGFNND